MNQPNNPNQGGQQDGQQAAKTSQDSNAAKTSQDSKAAKTSQDSKAANVNDR